MGQDHGESRSKNYNRNIQYETARVAIKDQLLNPTSGFEEIISLHFFFKVRSLLVELITVTNHFFFFF